MNENDADPFKGVPLSFVHKRDHIRAEILRLVKGWRIALRRAGYRSLYEADVAVHGHDEAYERRRAAVMAEYRDIVSIFEIFGASSNNDVQITSMIVGLIDELISFPTTATLNTLKQNETAGLWDRSDPTICGQFEWTLGTGGFNIFKDADVHRISRLLAKCDADYARTGERVRVEHYDDYGAYDVLVPADPRRGVAHVRLAEMLRRLHKYLIIDGALRDLANLAVQVLPYYKVAK